MTRPPLTDDQLRAVATRRPRTFIEAGPGAGKTTIAAERFGLVRYCRAGSHSQGVVAVSFTIAASQELRRRVALRWGSAATTGSSRVRTIDSEIVDILCLLLRRGLIAWPGGRTDVIPLDSWAGHPQWKYKRNPKWLSFTPRLVGKEVCAVREATGWHGFSKGDLSGLLADGYCTHEDVRGIVADALLDPELRAAVVEHRRQTVSHLIVDEVFDADLLDVDLIAVHCEADIPVTVVGDRWQALYEFRNARPQEVEDRLDRLGFFRLEVLQSHRYTTDEARHLAMRVRGESIPALAATETDDVDVVLAPWWSQLWEGPAWVFPISFGPVRDQTDAMLTLLLDHLLHKHLGVPARARAEALFTFGLDPGLPDAWPGVFDEIEQELSSGTRDQAAVALRELRRCAPHLRAGRVVRARGPDGEARALTHVQQLAVRCLHRGPFVRGVSVHQAKGQEWPRVGVRLTQPDLAALAEGLDIGNDRHRTLYVALTRGSERTLRVVGECLA